MRSRRRAFTLVELLVVIGIIGVLVSLLLPALGRVKDQARVVVCQSQLRQLGVALMLYCNQNQGQFPAWSGRQIYGGDGTGEDSPGLAWTEYLEPLYVRPDNDVYICPAFSDTRQNTYFLAAAYSYLTGRQTFKIGEIKLGSRFILSGDCTQASFYSFPWGTNPWQFDDVDKDNASQPCLVFADDAGGINIHKRGNNVLFADGHVGLYAYFDRQEMTHHPTEMRDWRQTSPRGGASGRPE